jgi:RNA polymerase sigma-70 factor (ECF subfamily)
MGENLIAGPDPPFPTQKSAPAAFLEESAFPPPMIASGSSHRAWHECYRLLAPKLLLFARQWAPSPADAEDIVQTAFVRFWQKQPDAGPEHYPLAYAAVRTAALDFLRSSTRRNRRETAYHDEQPAQPVPLFQCSLELEEEATVVQSALSRLSPEQREVLVLRIWGELTFAQIAQVSSESINTVASRYRTALQALRKLFSQHPPLAYERV